MKARRYARSQLALGLYAALAAAGLLWRYLSHGDVRVVRHPEPWLHLEPGAALGISVLLGGAIAICVIASTRALNRYAGWARTLHREFRAILHPLHRGEAALLAVSSGIGEEILFRGAMQPSLGLVLTSIIFGVIHMGPSRDFLPWTLWAIAMGFVFGGLYATTGHLAGCIVAHVMINWVNLRFIDRVALDD